MHTQASIVFIGAGKLATQLASAFYKKGFTIVQVYSPTIASAKTLAEKFDSIYTNEKENIFPDADVYIYAVKDDALSDIITKNPVKRGIHIHTAGSVSIDIFAGRKEQYGVLYPLQTFSKERAVDFQKIPIFIEANNQDTFTKIQQIALLISNDVQQASSEQRKSLHLGAVFACNFVNHLYAIAEKIVTEAGLPFDSLRPLIEETAAKVQKMSPAEVQTGPAVRFDEQIIQKHLDSLTDLPKEKEIYQLLSENIFRYAKQKKL